MIEFKSYDNGEQSDWTKVASINIKGNWLSPVDLCQLPDVSSKTAIKVTPGRFDIHLKLDCENSPCYKVKALRIIPENHMVKSKQLKFELNIDVATVTVFDRQSLFKQVSYDEREDLMMDMLEIEAIAAVLTVGSSSELFLCASGDGDGVYPVFELLTMDGKAGMEIYFKS